MRATQTYLREKKRPGQGGLAVDTCVYIGHLNEGVNVESGKTEEIVFDVKKIIQNQTA